MLSKNVDYEMLLACVGRACLFDALTSLSNFAGHQFFGFCFQFLFDQKKTVSTLYLVEVLIPGNNCGSLSSLSFPF